MTNATVAVSNTKTVSGVRACPLCKECWAKNAVSRWMLCPQGKLHVVGLEALTVVTPCSTVEVHRSCGRMYHLHLQGRRVTQRKQERRCRLLVAGFLLPSLFDPEDGGDTFLLNVGVTVREVAFFEPIHDFTLCGSLAASVGSGLGVC
jgi:hypothetical protein